MNEADECILKTPENNDYLNSIPFLERDQSHDYLVCQTKNGPEINVF